MTPNTNAATEVNPRRFQALRAHGQGWWLEGFNAAPKGSPLPAGLEAAGLEGILTDPFSLHRSVVGPPADAGLIGHAAAASHSAHEAYEALLIAEARAACDDLQPLFERSQGEAGFVGVMPAPRLVEEAGALETAARRLAAGIDRPNLVIRLPATDAALPALQQCVERGLNVEAALICSPERYAQAFSDWLTGLERRRDHGQHITHLRLLLGVALGPVDRIADDLLESCLDTESPAMADPNPAYLLGKVALANARRIYAQLTADLASARWRHLADSGAVTPQLLWCGLHHHNPRYRDLMYVDRLIGPNTAVALDLATAHAFSDHGFVDDTLPGDAAETEQVLDDLQRLSLDYGEIAARAEALALQELCAAYDATIALLHR